MPISQSITALSALLADSSSLPYVRKTCSYLLSRQLLRRDGIRGMFSALFSEEDALQDDAPLEKLENVARLLESLPVGMKETVSFNPLSENMTRLMVWVSTGLLCQYHLPVARHTVL